MIRFVSILKLYQKILLITLSGTFSCVKASAQDLPNTSRTKILLFDSDTIKIDTLSVLPGSLIIANEENETIPAENYDFNYASSTLIIKNNQELYRGKQLGIKYRVLQVDLSKPYYHKDTSLIIKNYEPGKTNHLKIAQTEPLFPENDELEKNGSISRGLAIGNQRDLSTMSNLNLQLSGKLNEEVSILAAISDNNMPIQASGNTQQIQEFDKVNIRLFTKNSGIELGDIDLEKPSGYYLNLKKQVRGLKLYTDFTGGKQKDIEIKSGFSAGLAKGKYNKQSFTGVEGNQGPYKLIGTNSEAYIIILSGSERVYIDGKLQTRGDKFDYIIDYNAAEIVFTANKPITKDSRIIVEYEYIQQYYPRLQFLQNNLIKTKNANYWINFYMERDNKNDPLAENYTNDIKGFLATIGDSIQNAIAPNVKEVNFSNDKVLYLKKDSLVGTIWYEDVYEYSTDSLSATYQLGFLYLGENKGNYRPVVNNANGKVYEWIAPVNGIRQGTYEPVSLYVSPKKTIMANMGGQFRINANGRAGFEVAFSENDVNTYSTIDKTNDKGYALKLNFIQNLLNKDTTQQELQFFANYRIANQYFLPVENFREIEFERDWNLTSQNNTWKEQFLDAGFAYRRKGLGSLSGKAAYMARENGYTGKNAHLSVNIGTKGFQVESNINYLNTSNLLYSTQYLKHLLMLSKKTKHLVFGVSEESEENRWKYRASDSLANISFKFTEYTLFIKQPDSSVNQYFVNYKFRKDYSPEDNALKERYSAQTAQAGMQFLKNQNFISKTILTYRKINSSDTTGQHQPAEDYLSGRQEFLLRLVKGAVMASAFYETGSGLEMSRQYQFIEVQSGQGQFTWIDYNQNGIKELDEFEAAKFQDEANYIQVYVPSNQYVRVYTTQMNQTISLFPERIWSKSKGIKGFVALFSNQFAFQVMQKTLKTQFLPAFNDNDGMMTGLFTLRNNFAYHTKNRKAQLNYLVETNNSKSLLVNGIDERTTKNHSIKLKYNIPKILSINNSSVSGIQEFKSEYFGWKNYRINNKSNEFSLELQTFKSLLPTVSYKYTLKNNSTGNEKVNINELKVKANQEMSVKVNLQAELSYIVTDFSGETSSSVAYEMLDGLKNGKNLLWSITYNQKLSKVLFLNLSYSGRQLENSPTIHNGSVQLRANF